MTRSEVLSGGVGAAVPPGRRRRWPLLAALVAAALWLLPVPSAAAASSGATLTWSVVTPPASPPGLRGAAAAYDSDNHTVVVFGGTAASGNLSNDTWVWDGSTWTDHSGGPVGAPPARTHAAMAFDPDLHQLILFGGQGSGGTFLGDTWAWNGASWYQLSGAATATSPSPRADAAMAYDHEGDLVLFGGVGLTGSADAPSSTAGPAPSTNGPAGPPTSSTTAPSGPPATTGVPTTDGSAASAALAGMPTTLGDTWVWSSKGWAPTPASGPSPRAGSSMAYDADHGETLLFGGSTAPIGSAGRDLADTWTWDGSQWSLEKPHTSPPGRALAVLDDDPAARGAVLFGGSGGSGTSAALDDTWRWDGTTWTAEPLRPPAARAAAAGAYDAASRQLVVFGGRSTTGGVLTDTAILTPSAPLTIHPGPPSGSTSSTSGSSGGATSSTDQRPTPGSSTSAGNGAGPSSTAPLVVTAHAVHQGDLVTLVGAGFMPGARVTITFHSAPAVVGEVTADPQGRFTATVAVPQAAAFGTHHFVADGEGRAGTRAQLVTAIRVVPLGASGRSLVETSVLVAVAVALPVGTWIFLDLSSRFRKRRTSQPA